MAGSCTEDLNVLLHDDRRQRRNHHRNHPSGEIGTVLAGAATGGGCETLTLPDGAHITFQTCTGLGNAHVALPHDDIDP